jgi:hypothetical protein
MVTTFLRIAAVVAFLQCAGHAFLVLSYVPSHGPQEIAVVEAMKLHRFAFQGFTRSYWDFYVGYGLFAAVNSFIEAVLFWILAGMHARVRATAIVVLFLAANVVYIVLSLKYFFFTPMIFDTVIAACLGLALMARRSTAG